MVKKFQGDLDSYTTHLLLEQEFVELGLVQFFPKKYVVKFWFQEGLDSFTTHLLLEEQFLWV